MNISSLFAEKESIMFWVIIFFLACVVCFIIFLIIAGVIKLARKLFFGAEENKEQYSARNESARALKDIVAEEKEEFKKAAAKLYTKSGSFIGNKGSLSSGLKENVKKKNINQIEKEKEQKSIEEGLASLKSEGGEGKETLEARMPKRAKRNR